MRLIRLRNAKTIALLPQRPPTLAKTARGVVSRAAWAAIGLIIGLLCGIVVGAMFFGALGAFGGFAVGLAFGQGGIHGAWTGANFGVLVGTAWGILLGGLWGLLFGATLGARARGS